MTFAFQRHNLTGPSSQGPLESKPERKQDKVRLLEVLTFCDSQKVKLFSFYPEPSGAN